MLKRERQRRILLALEDTGTAANRDLQALLAASPMTLWRDLNDLEERGLLRRVHGGVVRIDARPEANYEDKETAAQGAKRRIAAEAVRRYVRPTQVIFVEGGTTVAELVGQMPEENLTLVTNSIRLMTRVHSTHNKLQVHATGGMMSPISGNMIGREAIASLRGKAADLFFMSCTGISAEHGITDPNPLEIEVKQAMAERADKIVLLADASKIQRRSLHPVIEPARIDAWITDRRAGEEQIAAIRASGLREIVAV